MLLRHELFAQLRGLFADLYSDVESSRRIVADAGLDAHQIKFSARAADNWQEILGKAEQQKRMQMLFTIASNDFPGNLALPAAQLAYTQWAARGRLSWVRIAASSGLSLLLCLLILKWPPFQDRPIWSEIGRAPVAETNLLTRAQDVLIATTTTESDSCDTKDNGIWRSMDQGRTWEPAKGEPLLVKREQNHCTRAYVTMMLQATTITQTVLYATTSMLDNSDENRAGLLRSDDLGFTWTNLGQYLFHGENLGYVAFIQQEASHLIVATVGADNVLAGLYRFPSKTGQWEQIINSGPCQADYVNTLPITKQIFALFASQDAIYASVGYGLYRSSDVGNCWQKLDQNTAKYNYKAVAALPNQPNQLLAVTYDPTVWENSYAVRLFDLPSGLPGKPLWPSTQWFHWPLGQSIEKLYLDSASGRWFIANFSGMTGRGTYTGALTTEFLPTLTRCNINVFFGCQIAFAEDFTGETPLLLANGRLYHYKTGAWWRSIWP